MRAVALYAGALRCGVSIGARGRTSTIADIRARVYDIQRLQYWVLKSRVVINGLTRVCKVVCGHHVRGTYNMRRGKQIDSGQGSCDPASTSHDLRAT